MKKKTLSMAILSIVLISAMFNACPIATTLINRMENVSASTNPTNPPPLQITSIKPPPPKGVVQIYDPTIDPKTGKPIGWKTVTKNPNTGKLTPKTVPNGGRVKTGANTTVEVTYTRPKEGNPTKYEKITYRMGSDREVRFTWKKGYWFRYYGDMFYWPEHYEAFDFKVEKKIATVAVGGLCLALSFLGGVPGVIAGIAGFGYTLFDVSADSPPKVTVYNGTVSVRTFWADTNETIAYYNITGSLWFDENKKPWSWGQQVIVYDDGTISEPIGVLLNATGLRFDPYGSDSHGAPTAHYPNEDVYVSGYAALLPPNTNTPVYLMPESLEPLDYNPTLAKASGIALTDNWGNLPETFLWKPSTSDVGLYSIWVDTDNSASYTEGDIVNYIGVRVIPPFDIAVTDVHACMPSKTIVGQGFALSINATVFNYGNNTETFNVTVYANTTIIETKEVTLTSGNSTTLTFTWNTTGFAKGNYTISAIADTVPGETDTEDNIFTNGWVIVAMVGDIVPDGKCDMKDIRAVAKLFGINYPNPKYDPNCDINGDGKIDMKDIRAAAKNFGKIDP